MREEKKAAPAAVAGPDDPMVGAILGAALEPIHSLIREAIDADRASRGQAPAPARATADVFGLQWPGENRINLSTVFDTEAEALEYRDNRCDTPGILVVRLSASAYLAAQTAMCDDKEGERDA